MKRVLSLSILFILLMAGCQKASNEIEEKDNANVQDYVYTSYDVNVQDKVKLGDEEAKNTIVLAFDYSCHWCHKWMLEVLPVIEEKYIETGQAYYVGQPLVLLNETSLLLSHVDYYVEQHHPAHLYDIQRRMTEESQQENWGTENYIIDLLKEYNIAATLEELEKSNEDPISVTRNYTKNLAVQAVPTVYVNGIKLYDAFSLEEIEKALAGEITEGTTIQIPVMQ